ncbi:MAG: polysaccharide biosynthesis C-terminal domain-containing protein [Flavobacteriales bacterium]|nr:polysaccharide biosynthesis C-terminal domain-containing protein [Flavobacteriales bacterium]
MSLSFLLNILLDLGITNHNTRHLSQHPDLMRERFAGILGVRLVLVALYASLCLCAGFVLGYGAEQLHLLVWLIVNQALAAMLLYLRSNIAALQRYAQDSLLSVLDRSLLIGMVGWLLWGRDAGGAFRIEWFVWAQTVAYSATVLFAFAMLRRSVDVLPLRWDRGRSWSILRQSFPYALLILLMTFYYRTDTLMLERLLPDGALQAGIYAQAFRFFEACNMFGYLLAGLLLPMFSRLIKSGGAVASLAGMAFRLVWVGTLLAAVIGSVFAHEIMAWRYSEHVEVSAPVFAVLMSCFVAVCTTYVFGTLLTASGDLRTLNILAACGMVLNILLNLVLIPKYQALGAACASLITQVLMAAAQATLAARRFGGWRGMSGTSGPLTYLLVLVGCGAFVHAWSPGLWTGGAVILVTALLAAVATGTLRPAELRQALAFQTAPGKA